MSDSKDITIIRVAESPISIFSELYIQKSLISLAMELPWKQNQSNVSAIPEGEYSAFLRQDKDRDLGFTIELKNVPNRLAVQIHVGNVPADTNGCILVGQAATVAKNFIKDSKAAIAKLKETFYGTGAVASPDVEIRVRILGLPHPLRYSLDAKPDAPYLEYQDGIWWLLGGTAKFRYPEVFRDTKFFICKGDSNGIFAERYIRWPVLGGGYLQASKDLKNWKTMARGYPVVRSPASPAPVPIIDDVIAANVHLLQARKTSPAVWHSNDPIQDNDPDPHSRGDKIYFDFSDDPPDVVTSELDNTDTVDDYSDEVDNGIRNED